MRTIPNYGVVKVLHVYGKWSNVIYEGTAGYVENKYLKSGIIKPEAGEYMRGRIKLSRSSFMYMRAKPSTSAESVGAIPNGFTVEVIESGDIWSHIIYNGRKGYCMSKYIEIFG